MKKIIGFLTSLSLAITLMINPSCTKDYLEPVIFDIPDTVSFSANIIPIFNESCNKSGCHNTGGIAPDLSAPNAHFELWIFGFIDTAEARSSVLFTRMNSTSKPMPPVGKLTEDKVQLVLAWIEQGAFDN